MPWKWLLVAVALTFWIGCGRSDRPRTVRVTGKVTLDGQAVEGANVSFAPKSPGARSATAKTDAAGQFRLMTFEPGDGAVPGSYDVTIAKMTTPPRPYTAEQVKANPNWAKVPYAAPKDELPVKYKSKATSGLAAEVGSSGATEVNFELKSR